MHSLPTAKILATPMPPLSITIHNHIDRTPSALETGGGSLRSVCKQESATTAHR